MCRHDWRAHVEWMLEIPFALAHHLSKEAVRRSDVKSLGVNWPRMTVFCGKCGVWMKGFEPQPLPKATP